MRVQTILNRVWHFKDFVYEKCRLDGGSRLVVAVRPRKGAAALCGKCGKAGPVYDTAKTPRQFDFPPVWGFSCFLEYTMRRINCRDCGVHTERVPWADGKSQQTYVYRAFLAGWAKLLSWQTVAEKFETSWQSVYRAVQWVVEYGLVNRQMAGVSALGVDEVQWRKGHKYLTLVYQLDQGCRRLLWVGQERTAASFKAFFREMKAYQAEFCAGIRFLCSDMWQPYLRVAAACIPQAVHILDRFHVMQKFSKALDKVRASEVKRLREAGEPPVLKRSRWCFLKRRGNLTRKQGFRLRELLRLNLRTVRAYLLKEQFQQFWDYIHPTWAGKFLDSWCETAKRSRIPEIKAIAATLTAHRELLLNWFRAKKQYNNGIAEGMNYKVNLTVRRAFGYRSFEVIRTALYHQYGDLPEPVFTHRFW